MQEAANLLTGCHDFRNFCKMDVSNAVVEFVRAINSMKISICKKDTQFQNEGISPQNLFFKNQVHLSYWSVNASSLKLHVHH